MNYDYPNKIKENFLDMYSYDFGTLPKSYDTAFAAAPTDLPIGQFARWVTKESNIPWLQLDIGEFDWQSMYAEAMSLESEFIQHRANDYDENDPNDYGHRGWRSLTLHGLGKHVSQHWDSRDVRQLGFDFKSEEEARASYDWTEIAEQCPNTVSFIKSFPGYFSLDRVRFMYLEPGGYITPHSDGENNSLGPVNISLNNPDNCVFKMIDEDAYIPWAPGRAFKLNVNKRHAVVNDSDEPRIHIIVHGQYGGSDYAELIKNSWNKLVNDRR